MRKDDENILTIRPKRNNLIPLLIIELGSECLEYIIPIPIQNINTGALNGPPNKFPTITSYGMLTVFSSIIAAERVWTKIMNMIEKLFAMSSSIWRFVFILSFENKSFILIILYAFLNKFNGLPNLSLRNSVYLNCAGTHDISK